jgi:hypothetical protein
MVDVHQPGNHPEMQTVAELLPGLMDHEPSIRMMVVEHLMVVGTEHLLGLQGPRLRHMACNRMVLLQDPRLQDMEVGIPGDPRHQHISTRLPPMTVGDRINRLLMDGVGILTMHRRLERICQPQHLRL